MKCRILVVLLIAVIAFSSVGCKESEEKKVEIFSTYVTEKILQDVPVSEENKQPARFSFSGAKGERETAQIILTPNYNIGSYSISASDLSGENGVFSAENFTIYHQKYIPVTTGSDGLNSMLGNYPDALLPHEKAVEYGENHIDSGENQAIVIEVAIPSDQSAGVYSGAFSLLADGEEYLIGVSVEVYDVFLPETVSANSMFLIGREELIYGELDNSLEMYKKYCDTLLEYRITPYLLPVSQGDYTGYAAAVKEYYQNPAFTGYTVPAAYVYDSANACYILDKTTFKNYLTELVKISLEDGVNYLSKIRAYFGVIDEPELNGTERAATVFNAHFTQIKNEIADEILADDSLQGDKTELAQSIRDISNIVTNKKTAEVNGVDIWCPTINEFDMQANRAEYGESGEDVWWYTCNNPVNPYPSYHMDDPDGFVSARVMNWMQYDYGVSGNLYWETALYRKIRYEGGEMTRTYLDPYTEAEHYPGTNGDGFLFYPGAKYGIYGPVVSNRLVAIRDGLEEYELIKNLYETYSEEGHDAEPVMRVLYDILYTGTRSASGSAQYRNVRETLLKLCSFARDGVFFTEVGEANGVITVKAEAEEDEMSFNGEKVIAQETDEGFTYTFSFVADKTANVLTVAYLNEEITFDFGGRKSIVTDFETDGTQGFISLNGSIGFEVADDPQSGIANMLRCSFTDPEDQILWTGENFSDILDANTFSLVFKIYNPQNFFVTAMFSIAGNSVISVAENILYPGWNTVKILHIDAEKWNLLRKAESLRIRITDAPQESFSLYLSDIIKTEVNR